MALRVASREALQVGAQATLRVRSQLRLATAAPAPQQRARQRRGWAAHAGGCAAAPAA
jgi:hypothetical protein